MASKNQNVVSFRGEFDVSQIILSLKQIQDSMKKSGAEPKIMDGLKKSIEKAEIEYRDLQKTMENGFKNAKDVDNFSRRTDKLYESLQHISSQFEILNSNSKNFNVSGIAKAEKDLKECNDALKKFRKEQEGQIAAQLKGLGFNKDQAQALAQQIKNQEDFNKVLREEVAIRGKAVKEAEKEYKSIATGIRSEAASKVKVDTNAINMDIVSDDDLPQVLDDLQTIQDLTRDCIKNGKDFDETWADIEDRIATSLSYFKDIEQLQDKLRSISLNAEAKTYKAYDVVSNADDRRAQIGQFSNGEVQFSNQANEASKLIGNGFSEYNKALKEKPALEKAFNDAVEQSTNGLEKRAKALKENTTLLNNSREETERSNKVTKEAAQVNDELNKRFENMKNSIKSLMSIRVVFNSIRNIITQTYNDVKDLDKQFASIAMVTDYSVKQMWNSYDQYAKMAHKLGQNTKDVIAASALFYQQGGLGTII